jgi:hypothetical protein
MPRFCVLLLLLAGCAPGGPWGGDDFARPGTWAPSGVNDANLRAMLANPADAIQGRAASTERAAPATLAIRRLERDARRAMPNANASRVGISPAAALAPAAPPEASHAP